MEKSEEIVEEISQNVEQLEGNKRDQEIKNKEGKIWKWKYQLQRSKTWATGVIEHKIIKEIIKKTSQNWEAWNLREKGTEFPDESSEGTHATAHLCESPESPGSRGVLAVSGENTNHQGSGIRWH